MKRAPKGTARPCAGFPSPAEQYQELLGLRLPSKADAFSADILDLNELLAKRPVATYFVCVEGDFTVKTYRRDKSGVRLEPTNPNYPVIRLRAWRSSSLSETFWPKRPSR